MILSKDQQSALKNLLDFEKSKESMFCLSGSAGTGKTTLVGEYIKHSSKHIILSAPTHKAKKVLANKSIGTDVATIHSLLGLRVESKYGKETLKQFTKPATGNYLSVVVVDEASMIDDELMYYIKEDIKNANNKYIFVGDHCQLPPVNKTVSPIFEDKFIKNSNKVFLREIIRQAAGNPIIKVCTALRDMIESDKITDFEFETNSIGSVQVISTEEFIKLAKHYYLSSEYRNNSDFVKTIAWTNAAVHKYNSFVNKLFKVPDKEDFVVGTKVMFNEAYSRSNKILVQNNAEGTVVNIKKKIKDGLFYDTLTIDFDSDIDTMSSQKEFDVVSYTSRSDYNRILEDFKRAAIANKSWGKFYAMKEKFADVRPNFSLTSTKSQGSSFNNVIIDLNDIMKMKEQKVKLQHLYVAVSRASHNVYILE